MRWISGATVLFLLAPAAWAQPAEKTEAVALRLAPLQACKYLRNLQQSDGSFLPAAPDPKLDQQPKGSLRATSAAIRALKYFGGEVPDREAAAQFVKRCFDEPSGGFSDGPGGKPDVALSAIGIMAAVELKLPRDPYVRRAVKYLAENAKGFEDVRIAVAGMEAANQFPDIVKAWHEEVLKAGNGDGTWGKDDKARATGSAVALLLRSAGKLGDADRHKALEAMRSGQNADGGFGKAGEAPSELETSYRIMRAFHMMKEKPKEVPKLREFIGKCRNTDGGYAVAPGQPSTVGSTYYAAIIQHWLDEK
jgi:Prenyltransferase and squalene oxidase repeat